MAPTPCVPVSPCRGSARRGPVPRWLGALLVVALSAWPAAGQGAALGTLDGAAIAREMRALRRGGEVEQALRKVPPPGEGTVDPRVIGEQAQCLMDLGRWAEARALVEEVDGSQGVPLPIVVAELRLLHRRGDVDGTRKLLKRAQKAAPRHLDVRQVEVRQLIREERLADARRVLRELAPSIHREAATDLEVELELAQAAEYMVDDDLLERARPILEGLHEQHPGRGDVCALYARFLSRWQRFDEAEELLKDGLARSPSDDEQLALLSALGSLYRASQRDAEARQAFERVLELHPGDVGALVDLARCHNRADELDRAQARLDQALERRPGDLDALIVQAELETRRERYEQAEAALEQVLEIKPRHLKALWLLSRNLARQGRTEEMDAVLERYQARKQHLATR